MRAAFTPGEAFAGYRVEGLVARGGMGVVLRAYDPALERSVAIKLIAPELAENDRFRQRFLTETRLAAALDHPNVVPIHAAGEHDGQLYLAMRLVEGSDLKTLLGREGPLTPERTVDVLGQVADALDAAHRRGLVHRDVKPANVLLDEDGHAYLTDFGLTMAAGGEGAAAGPVQGTLDYLAPEQIRGEEVDARTDTYALACVLFECLAGVPPFRRDSEAETLWAHMQEAPPPLSAQGALEPVLERGLAKGMEERYSTCGELVVAASDALGLEPPQRRARRARGARLLVAGGLLGLVVAGVAAVLVGSPDEPTVARSVTGVAPNSVAVLDPRTGRIEKGIDIPGRPSLMASRGRSVWVANDDARTVAALDARAMALRKVVPAAVGASDIATSPDAVWLVDAIRHELVRMDAAYGNVTDRLPLRGDPRLSRPGVDVGLGGVWASDGANGLLELNPLDGDVRRRIDVGRSLDHLVAGEGAVWAIESGAPAVVRIDPMRGSIRTIPIEGARGSAAPAPMDITTGHGAVWVLNANTPSVTRIDPRRAVVSETVLLGVGSNPSEIAAGAGAVWVALAGEGSLARISPDGGRVRKLRVGGAPAGVTVAAGRVFASVQPGFRALSADRGGQVAMDGAVDESFCGPVEYQGPGKPDLLIVSDLPLQLPRSSLQPLQFTDAIRVVLARRGFRAGRHHIGYQSCDDSNVATGQARADPWTPQTCRRNARAYVRAPAVVGVIGPFSSSCAASFIPVVNRAPGGALATISATATAVGLTSSGPGALPGEPDVYYPSGVRNFARVVAPDNLQGAAAAVMARRLGLRRLFILTDGSPYGAGVAETAERAARMLGIEIAGPVRWDPRPGRNRDLAKRVERSGADGVFLGGYHFTGGSNVLRDLRATVDPRVRILAPDGFSEFGAVVEAVGAAAEGLIVTIATLPPERQPPAGRRFTASFGRAVGGPVDPYSVTTAQAVDVLLDAMSASDGTRASITEALLEVEVENGILGDFGFDANGDTTSAAVTIYEIEGGRERVRATITPPARLIAE